MPRIGDVVKVKVISIKKNKHGNDVGARVKLPTGEIAFLSVRELDADPKLYVKNVEDYVKKDESIEVRIIRKDKKFNEWQVSLRRANDEVNNELQFQKKLERFMKDSKSKLQQIQKNTERKQGTKKKRKPVKDKDRER